MESPIAGHTRSKRPAATNQSTPPHEFKRSLSDQSDPDSSTPETCCMCGEPGVHYLCIGCGKKKYCEKCQIKWHKNPKRQTHQYEDLSVRLVIPSKLNIDGDSKKDSGPAVIKERETEKKVKFGKVDKIEDAKIQSDSDQEADYTSANEEAASMDIDQSDFIPVRSSPKGSTELHKAETSLATFIDEQYSHHLSTYCEENRLKSLALITQLQEIEKSQFSVEQGICAMQIKPEDRNESLESWLANNWDVLITQAIVQVSEADIGPFSDWEITMALEMSRGDIKKVVGHVLPQMRSYQLAQLRQEYRLDANDDELCELLSQTDGNVYQAQILFTRKKLQDHCKKQNDGRQADVISDIHEAIENGELDHDHRCRMLMVDGNLTVWARATMLLDLVANQELEECEATLTDLLQEVNKVESTREAINNLKNECEVCTGLFPRDKIQSLTFCQCRTCNECFVEYFALQIRENAVHHFRCPVCHEPNLNEYGDEEIHIYFNMLGETLKRLNMSPDLCEQFDQKLRDRFLINDDSFRWCSNPNCRSGFTFHLPDRKKMRCPACGSHTCFDCQKPWKDQHDGITCEQFAQWEHDDDPEYQRDGLNRFLGDNDITCPACNYRYELARGGCMDFTCTQCGEKFCQGCKGPFRNKDRCEKGYASCANMGLHCHHPRNCFFYLRDWDVKQLQRVLEENEEEFRTEVDNPDQNCVVVEQQESPDGKVDAQCANQAQPGFAGFCEKHYKEYLVGVINSKHLDPAKFYEEYLLEMVVTRENLALPQKEPADDYFERLLEVVETQIPLPI